MKTINSPQKRLALKSNDPTIKKSYCDWRIMGAPSVLVGSKIVLFFVRWLIMWALNAMLLQWRKWMGCDWPSLKFNSESVLSSLWLSSNVKSKIILGESKHLINNKLIKCQFIRLIFIIAYFSFDAHRLKRYKLYWNDEPIQSTNVQEQYATVIVVSLSLLLPLHFQF